MKTWVTEILAYDHSNELQRWIGPHVPGINMQDAQRYCEENGLGYCKVLGELVAEIPAQTAEHASILNLNREN